MNVVNSLPAWALGQAIDPSTGIIADVQLGPEDIPPDYIDPNITYGPGSGAPTMAPAPSVSVPKPPTVPGFTFPSTTVRDLYPQGLPPGPSPRVNVPLSPSSAGLFLKSSTLVSGIPNWALVAGAVLAIPLLGGLVGGGGRRRR